MIMLSHIAWLSMWNLIFLSITLQGRQFHQGVVLTRKVTKVRIESNDERSKAAERETCLYSHGQDRMAFIYLVSQVKLFRFYLSTCFIFYCLLFTK